MTRRDGVTTYEDLAEPVSIEELIQRAEERGAEWLIGEPVGADAPCLVLVAPYKCTLLTRDGVQDLIDALSVVAVRAWGTEGESAGAAGGRAQAPQSRRAPC